MQLSQTQPRILNLFDKQIQSGRVSHAYLLVGESETRKLAEYMTQSLFCTQYTDKACGQCEACLKVINHNHGDFVFISGQDKSIKKEDVMNIKTRFIQTSLENVKHKVYVIEDVDNASHQAMNSFLKFLEEPESNIVAILTTSNINNVLETIKSRCLILNLQSVDKKILETKLLEDGIDPYNAKVLSYIATSFEEAIEIHDDKMFHQVLDTFHDMKKLYQRKKYVEAGIKLQVDGIKNHKYNLEAMKWLCELHEITYSLQGMDDAIQISFRDMDLLRTSVKIKDRIRPGVMTSMLIDQFVYELNKGE